KPLMVKTRSIGRRGSWSDERGGIVAASSRSVVRTPSSPAPVFADAARTGTLSKSVPRTSVATSSFTSSSQQDSTRSALVRSMWPAVPTTTCRGALPLGGGTGERPRQGDDAGREDRAAVEQQAIVGNPPDDCGISCAECLIQHACRAIRGAHGDGGSRQHDGG